MALAEGAENREEDGLRVGAGGRVVAVRSFAHQDGRANRAFSMIIVERNVMALQEIEERIAVFFQAFHESEHLRIAGIRGQKSRETRLQKGTAVSIRFCRKVGPTVAPKPNRIANETFACFENAGHSSEVSRYFSTFSELAEQMNEAFLLAIALNRIVVTPKIRDPNTVVKLLEKLLKCWFSTAFVDEICRSCDDFSFSRPPGSHGAKLRWRFWKRKSEMETLKGLFVRRKTPKPVRFVVDPSAAPASERGRRRSVSRAGGS